MSYPRRINPNKVGQRKELSDLDVLHIVARIKLHTLVGSCNGKDETKSKLAEPNRAGPAVQTMLAWFGPAHFSSV